MMIGISSFLHPNTISPKTTLNPHLNLQNTLPPIALPPPLAPNLAQFPISKPTDNTKLLNNLKEEGLRLPEMYSLDQIDLNRVYCQ